MYFKASSIQISNLQLPH